MNNDNLKLWDSVQKTDPSHTKKAKIGQMSITAICPQYQRKNATIAFGPYGSGWGVEDQEFSFMDFADQTKLCTYTATFWYMHNDKKCAFPIQSNIKVAFVTQGGKGYLKIDDEYSKKAATDALTKGLSMLGFNSDVFEGKYDDSKYVNQMVQEFAPAPIYLISDKQQQRLMAIGGNKVISEVKAVIAKYGFDSSKKITTDKYDGICKEVEKLNDKEVTK